MFKNITIRRKFIAAFVVLLAFAFLSAAWSIYSIYNIQQLNDANRRVLAINMLMENARKNEKAFLLSEVIDPSFYKNRRSTFQDSTIQVLQQAKENLDILMNSELADDTAFAESFGRINQYIINYNETFDALTTAALARGWKDYGTVGHLREAIHWVENAAFPNT